MMMFSDKAHHVLDQEQRLVLGQSRSQVTLSGVRYCPVGEDLAPEATKIFLKLCNLDW